MTEDEIFEVQALDERTETVHTEHDGVHPPCWLAYLKVNSRCTNHFE